MPLSLRSLLVCSLVVGSALPGAALAQIRSGAATRDPVRAAVEHHRASQRDQIRSDEAAAGRRLTPAERAELREQLRRQWASRQEATQTADSAGTPGLQPTSGQNASGGWWTFLPWVGPRP